MPLWVLLSPALAYETDNLTDRHLLLDDITEELDDYVNDVIVDAIADTNERTACERDPGDTRRILARRIHVALSTNKLVGGRKGMRPFGFDRYSAWIETSDVPKRSFLHDGHIVADVPFGVSPVLNWAGTCSTVRIGDVYVGTDKLDHFFEEGYNAWRRADRGEDPDRATDWATETELGRYGLKTSDTFSFADLRADLDGYAFYDTLLDPDAGVAAIGDDGCLEATHPFTWAEIVTWEYDEVLNPPVYTRGTQAAVARHLEAHRDAYCESYSEWGGAWYTEHLAEVLAENPHYAGDDAPARTDPYELEELCTP